MWSVFFTMKRIKRTFMVKNSHRSANERLLRTLVRTPDGVLGHRVFMLFMVKYTLYMGGKNMGQKSDIFTKIVLSVIALCLVVIALALIFETEDTQAAQSRFNPRTVQVTYTSGGFLVFDTTTGDIWMYDFSRRNPDFIGRLAQPGKALLTK